MVVCRDASSPARAARIATVLPAPTSPVTTPRARSLTHQLIRARASAWLVWRCSIWGARALPKGIRVNPYGVAAGKGSLVLLGDRGRRTDDRARARPTRGGRD